MACLLKVGVQYHVCWMEGFHNEPRAAGVFVPGHASTSIGDVSGLAKKPSADVLMTLPTLELGKSTSNLSLEGGAPTPNFPRLCSMDIHKHQWHQKALQSLVIWVTWPRPP